jgi:hypothetical protein
VRRPIYEAHPEWAYQSPQGRIIDYNGDVHVCPNSAYQQECMLSILEEMLNAHSFDGVFFNMSGYQTHDYSGNYYGTSATAPIAGPDSGRCSISSYRGGKSCRCGVSEIRGVQTAHFAGAP